MSYLIDTADRLTHLKIIMVTSICVTMLMAAALVIHLNWCRAICITYRSRKSYP
jgi:hypothetical protein